MPPKRNAEPELNDNELFDLVKVFEGFSQASNSFVQSYRVLEQRVNALNEQLEEQARLLQRTEGFLSSVLSQAPVGILVINLDGYITLFNTYAERITGLTSSAIIGKPYSEVFPGAVTEPRSALFTLTNGTIIEQREKLLSVSGGSALPVRFSTSWVFEETGEPVAVMELFEDLRDLKRIEKQMEQNANLASLGEMAAQVAHELRNPLAGVQGFVQFLQEDIPEDAPERGKLDKIVSGVKDIDHIARRLLEFTSPISPEFSKTDLFVILESDLDLISSEIESQQLPIQIHRRFPQENIPVECDPHLLKQAVLNLLKNALNAIDGEGTIQVEISWNLLKNRVRCRIKDSGKGIEQDNLRKIFYPFFTTRTKGTGLGLSMVKKIVDAHNGEILVDSVPGKGSTFDLILPIARVS